MLMVANPVKMAPTSRGGGADSLRASSHGAAGRSSVSYGSSRSMFRPEKDKFWEIELIIHQGTDLAAKDRNILGQRTTSDPYVQVDLLPEGPSGGSELALGLTRILFKTLTPKWGQGDEGEHFKACIPSSQLLTTCNLRHNNAQLRLKIYDHDDDSSDDLMGIVSIPISEPVDSQQEWYDVPETSARNASGKIQCSLKVGLKSSAEAAAEKDPHLKLGIHVMSGQYLAAKDRNALGKRFSSDPYVKLDLLFFRNSSDPLGTRHGDVVAKPFKTIKLGKTKIKDKTLSPIWNEKFDTILCEQTNSRYDPEQVQVKLQLTIMDHDKGSEDDLMGVVTIPIMVNPLENQINHHWYAVPPDSCRHASGRMQVLMETEWQNLKNIKNNNKVEEQPVKESPKQDTDSSSQPANTVGGDILNYLYKNATASVDTSFKSWFATGTISTNDKANDDNKNEDDEDDGKKPKATKAAPVDQSSTELGDDDDEEEDEEPNEPLNPFASTCQVKKIGQRSGIQSRRMTTGLRASTNSLRGSTHGSSATSSSSRSTRKMRSRPSSSPNLLELGKSTDRDDNAVTDTGRMKKSSSSHCLPPRSAASAGRRMLGKTRSSRSSDGPKSLGSSDDLKNLYSRAHEEDLSSSDQSRQSSKSRSQRRGSEEGKTRASSQHRRSSSSRLLDSPSKDPTNRRRSRRLQRTSSNDTSSSNTEKADKHHAPKFARQRSRSLDTGTPRRISNRRSSSRHLRSGLAANDDGMDANTEHASNTSSDKRRASSSKLSVDSSLPRVTREKGLSVTKSPRRSQSRSKRAQRSNSLLGFETPALDYNDEAAASATKKSGSKSMRRQRSSSMGFGTSTTTSVEVEPKAPVAEEREEAGPKFTRQRSRSLESGTSKRDSKSRSSSRHLRSAAPTDDSTSSPAEKDGPKLARQRSRSLETGTSKKNSKSRSSSRRLRTSSPTDDLTSSTSEKDGPNLTRQRSRSLETGTSKRNSKSRSSSRHLRSGSPGTDDPASSTGENTETGISKRNSKSRSSSRQARSGSPSGEEAKSSKSMKRRPSSGKLLVDSTLLRSTREKGPSTTKDSRTQSKSRKPRRSKSMSDDPKAPMPEKADKAGSRSMRRQRSMSMASGTSTMDDPSASSKGKASNLRASTGSGGAPNLRASTSSSGSTGRGSSSKRSK